MSHRLLVGLGEPVVGTAPAARVFHDDAALDQFADVAQSRVARALGELGVLRRGEMPFEIVQHPVDDLALSLVHRLWFDPLPQLGFAEHRAERRARVVDRAVEAVQEPREPRCDVEAAALCGFELPVVLRSDRFNPGRHAVEALLGAVRLR